MIAAPAGYTPIAKLPFRVDVQPIAQALEAHPELWNQQTARTESPQSPHHGLDDIWCRFADPATMRDDGSHDSVWYPPADVLPVRAVCLDIMRWVDGTQLGGVLITRIPAGKQCRPHVDPGWHARHYEKIAVSIAAAPRQSFRFVGHELVTEPGDVFWFDNAYTHWVTNDSQSDRVTLIVCVRTERI